MRKTTYAFLLLVRLWFALSFSYIQPDEHFQGPEVIAGQIFNYRSTLTWEFTSDHPVRSVFPLWLTYGLPMMLLRSVLRLFNNDTFPPYIVFLTLRTFMFTLSFLLEDRAIQILVKSPAQRVVALLLVASSYVTWTYQMHTFSNAVETILVLWCFVFMRRIVESGKKPSTLSAGCLGCLAVFGIFNRITFPAFLVVPGIRMIPHIIHKPRTIISLASCGIFTILLGIYLDTAFYSSHRPVTLSTLLHHPVITTLNNLSYNSQTSNLAIHGLHPWYKHFLANLPQLIGPAIPLLFISPRVNLIFVSAIAGVALLSVFPHQEARFLSAAVPMFLMSVQLPKNVKLMRLWLVVWVGFNIVLAVLMGKYHQGGVLPAQLHLAEMEDAKGVALWWRTYRPPVWLLGDRSLELNTTDLSGMQPNLMVEQLEQVARCRFNNITSDYPLSNSTKGNSYLVAPLSAIYLDRFTDPASALTHAIERRGKGGRSLVFEKVWETRSHVTFDNMDVKGEGVFGTFARVIGRRGIAIWKVSKTCEDEGGGGAH